MNIHIACAFYRQHLLKTQEHYLEKHNIEWIPICDSVDIKAFANNSKKWIRPVLVPPLRIPGDQVYKKFNDFIEKENIIDEDYYGFMGDDDAYEPGFFDVIREQKSKVVIFSLSRGNAIPADAPPQGRHPTSALIMDGPWNVKVCNIGIIQYIVKGSVLREMRFNNSDPADDGRFAEELVRRYPNDISFLSTMFAFGNYLEPGRYTDNSWKKKETWELPQIIKE